MRRIYLLATLFATMLSLPTTSTHAEENPAGKLTGTIGDFVWRDLNSNGVQDGEPGLANVYVELQTAAGGWVNAVFTNSNGGYSFTGVAPGSYRVKFANPGGFFQSPENVGSDASDSDADMNGFSPVFTVAAGQVINNLDAGFRPQSASTCSLGISGGAGTKTCNDNGTPNNPADDVYTFDFTANITSNPNGLPVWGYKIQINNTTVYGMYGMPITVGPIPVSAGSLTWTLVDDDNPTCSISGTVTPPNNCSGGGNCVTSAVRTISNTPITCGQPANLYGFWFNNLNTNLSKEWLWESGSMVENSNGTANILGIIYNKTKVNAKFAVDIILSGRTFSAPAGSPKVDDACAGTNTAGWYYYNSVVGHLTGINDVTANELAGASISFTAFGPKAQFGTGASLRNPGSNGGSSWLNYTVTMQPVNVNLQLSPNPVGVQGADFNFQLSGSPLTNCAATGVLTFNCTNNITVTAAAGATTAVVNYTAPTATSTCTTGSVSVSKTSGLNSGSAFPVGTSTVVYTATDGCGNVKTCSFTVTVNPGGNVCNDVTYGGLIGSDEAGCPSFDPAGMTETAAPSGGSGAFEYVWLSSTTGCPTNISQAIPGATGMSYDPGVISQTTWYVRCVKRAGCPDFNGTNHESNCVKKEVKTTGCGGGTPDCNAISITPGSGNIAISGLSAPIIIVQIFNSGWASVFNQTYSNSPGNITVPSLPAGVYYVKVNFLNASWAAICQKDGYFTVGGGGNTGVLTFNCTNNITVTAATGATTAVVNYTAPTATSTCTTGSVSVSKTSGLNSGSAFPVGTSTVVYQATDGCGNVKTCSFTVTVNPGASACNLNINVSNIQCDGKGTATTSDDTYTFNFMVTGTGTGATWSGSFDNAYLGTFAFGPTAYGVSIPMGPFPAGAFTPGNVNPPPVITNGVNININVNDTQNPSCSKSTTVNSPGPCSPTTGPDCNAISITPGAGNIAISGLSAPIIMVQIFNSGWASVFNQTYSNSPGNITVPSLPAGVYYVKVNFLNASWAAICQKDGYFTVGGGGNTGVLTFNCTNNITVTAGAGANSAVVNYTPPTASTTCAIGATVVKTSGLQTGSPFPIGTSTVCYQATDGCGNVKTCCFTVTVNSGGAAMLNLVCNNNITVTAAVGANSAVVTYSNASATTTCAGSFPIVIKTSGINSGSAFPVGTSTVCYQATDDCGNVKTCCFTVTVNAAADPCANETVPPTINGCPGNQTKTVAAKYNATNTNKCGTTGTYGMWLDFVNDNLNHFDISNAMFWENADGSATLTGTATSQGNANLKFNINVTWTGRVTAPPSGSPKSLDCTAQVSTYGNNVRFYTGMSGTLTGSGSASNGVTFTISRRGPAFQVGNGANLRSTGLGASGWFTMVKSGSNPNCPAVTEGDFNFNMAATTNTATATWTAPTATDNCGTPTLTSNYSSGATFPVGTTTVSYTATDAKNNKSTCNFNIVVNQVNPGGGNMVDPTKCYYIKCKSTGKVCDAQDRDSWGSGTYCNQWYTDNTSSQKWKFQDAGNGYFYCVSQNSSAFGKVLCIKDASTSDAALCNVITPNNSDATKFCFQDAGNGYVYIVAKHSGKGIKLVSDTGLDGTQCNQQAPTYSNNHQKWEIVEVSCTGAFAAPSNTLTFNAFRKGLNSELKWINNTGDKNEFFDIERSLDGDNFTKIGRVDGKGGNAGDQLYFQAFDRNPAVGDNIYRLKMVWKDGTVSYSNEQTVHFDEIPALGIYPNPAVDELFIDLSSFVGEKLEVNMVNNLGVQVFNKTIDKAEDEAHRLDIRDIPSGSYRLFIQPETSRPEVRQLIVEKF